MSRGIVTRTIRTLIVDGIFADTKAEKIVKERVFLPYRKFVSKPQVEKYVRKNLTRDDLSLVSVESWETGKTLYGCTEEHFMQFAEPYDEVTRKPIEEKEN